jgi:hypothetical protein
MVDQPGPKVWARQRAMELNNVSERFCYNRRILAKAVVSRGIAERLTITWLASQCQHGGPAASKAMTGRFAATRFDQVGYEVKYPIQGSSWRVGSVAARALPYALTDTC